MYTTLTALKWRFNRLNGADRVAPDGHFSDNRV
jgi:hypothetical protein